MGSFILIFVNFGVWLLHPLLEVCTFFYSFFTLLLRLTTLWSSFFQLNLWVIHYKRNHSRLLMYGFMHWRYLTLTTKQFLVKVIEPIIKQLEIEAKSEKVRFQHIFGALHYRKFNSWAFIAIAILSIFPLRCICITVSFHFFLKSFGWLFSNIWKWEYYFSPIPKALAARATFRCSSSFAKGLISCKIDDVSIA